MITGHFSGEELSSLGKTGSTRNGVITYLNSADVSFSTPKTYTRFFLDSTTTWATRFMKECNMQFLALSEQQNVAQEIYVLTNTSTTPGEVILQGGDPKDKKQPKADFMTVTELADANEAERQQLMGWVSERLTHEEDYYDATDLQMAYEEIGGRTFLVTTYCREASSYKEYDGVIDYITIIGGYCIESRCYSMNSSPVVQGTFEEQGRALFDPLMEQMVVGDATNIGSGSSEGTWLAKLGTFSFSLWVLLIPLIYILICGVTYIGKANRIVGKKNETVGWFGDGGTGWHEDVLSLSISKGILGFFAVLIVFHHLAQKVGASEAGIVSLLETFGVGFVAAFFFFSGFGLFTSYKSKKDYLKGFFRKRFPAILIPAYIIIAIFIVVNIINNGMPPIKYLIGWMTGFLLINGHMWYIVEIALFYTLFFLVFRFVKKEWMALTLMGVAIAAFTVGSLLLGHGEFWFQGEWWFNTSFVFFLGILFAKHKDRIIECLRRFYPLWLIAASVGFVLLYRTTNYFLEEYSYYTETNMSMGYADKFRCLSVQLPMVIVFMLLVILIGMKFRFKNPVMDFLGKISLELYLIHNLFIDLMSFIKGSAMYCLAVVVCSIIAATLLHRLNTIIMCKIAKKQVPVIVWPRIPWRELLATAKLKIRLCLQYTRRHPGKVLVNIFRTVVCLFLCVVALYPIYTMFINSTRTTYSIVHGASLIPEGHFFENYRYASEYFVNGTESKGSDLYSVILYSCVITGGNCLLATYFGSLCAYGFEFYKFKGKSFLWKCIIVSLMLAPIAGVVGFLKIVIALHMYDTCIPLILMGAATPATAYFMRMYLRTQRLNEMVEAARIDGCREWRIYNRIILPVIKPAIMLQIIMTFATSWNNTIYQNLILLDVRKKTIATSLLMLVGNNGGSSNPVIYTILLLVTVPPLVVYIICSQGIMAGVTLGSVKE